MGKSICEKHQRAFETECPYCEPPAPADGKHASVDLAAWVKDSTLDAYAEIVKSYYNPWAAQVSSTTSAPEIEAAMNDAWAMLAAKEPAPALILPRGTMLPCTLSGLHCLGIPVVVDHSLREGEWRLEAGKIHAAKDVNDTLRATVTPPPARSSFSIAEEVVREVAKESGVEMDILREVSTDEVRISASGLDAMRQAVHYVWWVREDHIAARSHDTGKLRSYIRAQAEQCVRGLRKAAIPFHPEG